MGLKVENTEIHTYGKFKLIWSEIWFEGWPSLRPGLRSDTDGILAKDASMWNGQVTAKFANDAWNCWESQNIKVMALQPFACIDF